MLLDFGPMQMRKCTFGRVQMIDTGPSISDSSTNFSSFSVSSMFCIQGKHITCTHVSSCPNPSCPHWTLTTTVPKVGAKHCIFQTPKCLCEGTGICSCEWKEKVYPLLCSHSCKWPEGEGESCLTPECRHLKRECFFTLSGNATVLVNTGST